MKKEKEPSIWTVIGLVAFIVFTWVALGLYASDRPEPGEFGDMFGAANALFAGLAFGMLIYANWLQRIELRLQRRELEQTRTTLEGQKEQLEAQNRTLQKQNFEDTFFQLLRLHNDIVGSIDIGKGERTTIGRDCFAAFYKQLQNAYVENLRERKEGVVAVQVRLSEVYSKFYQRYEHELGHYFRSLYNMVKFVKNSNVTDKRLYTNLVRAQLSSFELILIFYNCLSGLGQAKFKPLVIEFDLLKHLPTNRLLDPAHASLFH